MRAIERLKVKFYLYTIIEKENNGSRDKAWSTLIRHKLSSYNFVILYIDRCIIEPSVGASSVIVNETLKNSICLNQPVNIKFGRRLV